MMVRWAALGAFALVLAGCSQTKEAAQATTQAVEAAATSAPGVAFKDGLIFAAAKARLGGVDIDSAGRVHVSVKNGRVTLSGIVPTEQIKAKDVAAVRGLKGVVAVDDEIRVGTTGPGLVRSVSDAALVTAVASALAAQTGVNVADVRIHANGGVVTLAGHAKSAALRDTMVSAAKGTPGVRNVVDRIAVRS